MKKLFILLAFFTLNCTFGQLRKGIVYYGYIDSKLMGNSKGADTNAYMVFNKEQSYYVTAKDSLERGEIIHKEKITENEDGSGGVISSGMQVDKQGQQVVYSIRKNTMWSNLIYKEPIYVKEIAPKINWEIEKETKKIGVFMCKKATTNFRGRDYTAWFTIEVALPFGPWKLNGLPGLILEAYDTNKNVYWYFKNIEYPTKNKTNVKYISAPKGMEFKSYEDFKIFQKKMQNLSIDKNRIVGKKFPNVIFPDPKLSEMFIEFE